MSMYENKLAFTQPAFVEMSFFGLVTAATVLIDRPGVIEALIKDYLYFTSLKGSLTMFKSNAWKVKNVHKLQSLRTPP